MLGDPVEHGLDRHNELVRWIFYIAHIQVNIQQLGAVIDAVHDGVVHGNDGREVLYNIERYRVVAKIRVGVCDGHGDGLLSEVHEGPAASSVAVCADGCGFADCGRSCGPGVRELVRGVDRGLE